MSQVVDLWQRAWLVASPQSLFERIRSNKFLRRAGLLSSGSALGHTFTLAASPLLTRIYGPADFGALGLFTSFLSVAGVAVALQYESSIVSAANDAEAGYLTLAAAFFTLPTSIVSGLVMWVLVRLSLLGFGGLAWYTCILLSLVMCFVGVFTVLRYWNLRQQSFLQVSQAVVVQSAARAFLQTISGALGWHSGGLILGETLGRGLGMGRMFRSAVPELRRYAQAFRWEECKQTLWRNRKFPLYSLPSSMMDAVCVGLILPLLIQYYGAQSGGFYSLVWRAIALPSVLITLAVADTFHSHMAVCARETPSKVTELFRRTSLTLLLVGFIPFFVLHYFAPEIFAFIFGRRWIESGRMAVSIAPWFLAQFVVNPVSRVVFVLSGQEIKLAWDVMCICSIPAVFYFARVRGLAALQTVRVLSGVSTALYVVYFLTLMLVIARFNQSPSRLDA